MKRKIAALSACLLSSSAFVPAMAADVYAPGSTKDAPGDYATTSATRSWSGLYIGIEAGGGVGVFDATREITHGINAFDYETDKPGTNQWNTGIGGNKRTNAANPDGHRVDGDPFLIDSQKHDVKLGLDGLFGGLNVEYLHQSGRLVFGVGGDFDFGSMKASDTVSREVVFSPTALGAPAGTKDFEIGQETSSLTAEKKWNGDLMAKLGYLVTPDSMIYARAGVSWAQFAVKGSSQLSLLDGNIEPFPSSTLDNSETLTGWKVALGGSTRLTSKLVGSIEGAYADYGSISDAFGKSADLFSNECGGIAGSIADQAKGDLTEWTVKAKLTYQISD